MKTAAFSFALVLLALVASCAETWNWLAKTNVTDAGKTLHSYGGATFHSTNNWLNAASATNGLPRSGDFVVSSGAAMFGEDFGSSCAFGGVRVLANSYTEFVSQGALTLQAGGEGLTLGPLVTSVGTLNGYLVFTGSGTGVVEIANAACRLNVQKSCYGNADVTFVKRGAGKLVVNDYYHPVNDSRDATTGYSVHRKFAFGRMLLQGGTFVTRQYYAVSDLEFVFDGEDVVLDLCGVPPYSTECYNPISWRLKGGSFGETARCSPGRHTITAQSEKGILELAGMRTSTEFTGAFTGAAGLVWNPDNDVEFVLRKSVSTTTGSFSVLHGTLRLTDGAGMSALSSLSVASNAVFSVDETANHDLSSATFNIRKGAKISVARGARVLVRDLFVDGEAVANGVYNAADWLSGGGELVVGAVTAVWNGSGSANSLSNWQDAAEVPDLTNGLLRVIVAGGDSFVADQDVSVAGFVFNSTNSFSLSAATNHSLLIGFDGITNAANAALAFADGGGSITLAADQTWHMGSGKATFASDIRVLDSSQLKFEGSSYPVFAGSLNFAPKLVFSRSGAIVAPVGCDLTFENEVTATNGASLSAVAQSGSMLRFLKLFISANGGGLSGAGKIVFNGPCHFRDRPTMSGSVVVELHAKHNRLNGNMGTFSGGTLRAMSPFVITRENTRRQSSDANQATMINAKDDFVLDLNGFDQSIETIAMHADGTKSGGRVVSSTPATLHLQNLAGFWPCHNYQYGFTDCSSVSKADGYGYESMDKGRWEGAVSLSFEAAASNVRSMMRVSSSTGSVIVVSGRLVFLRRAKFPGETFDLKCASANPVLRLEGEDGAWPLARTVEVRGGVLKLEHSLAFGRDVDVFLTTGGLLELDEGVTQGCRNLYIDGELQSAGRFYSANETSLITGKGSLYVRGQKRLSAIRVR